jgi:cytochrome oxidase Cu insertion factor (SCO1/SenC/PrrC family)
MSETPAKTRRSFASLWLIIALCIAPVAASYLAYYFFLPQGHVNYGELVGTRPLPASRLQLEDGTAFSPADLRGKWVLLMTDGGACEAACRGKLFALRQLRLTQGREMTRIERVWLISDAAAPPPDVLADFKGTWLVRAAGSDLLKALPAKLTPEEHIYLVDPLGNLVLRYARDADPSRIIKDLARLLKTSQIG